MPSETLPSIPLCGAQLRNKPGTSCRNEAGKNTPHLGQGRCWIHGGLTPVTTGRYSTIVRREIQDLLKQFATETDPLDIIQDLHMVRALLVDFLNRYEENRDALLAWHASWNGRPWRTDDLKTIRGVLEQYEVRLKEDGTWEEEPEPPEVANFLRAKTMVESMDAAYLTRPREVLDISDGHRMAVEATKIVERIEKIRARGNISKEDFTRVMLEMARAVEVVLAPSRIRQVMLAKGIEVGEVPEMTLIEVADILRNALSEAWMTLRVM